MHGIMRGLIIATGLFISGCNGLLPEPAPPPAEVDFGPAVPVAGDTALPAPVTLARVQAPSWLQGTAIHYRQAETAPNLLERYAHHVWAAPPAELFGEQVEAMLRTRAPDPAAEATPARLELRLTRFEQVLDGTGQARAEARVTATLQRPGSERAQQREFVASVDTGADIGGAIEGLPAAAGRITRELGTWLETVLDGE